MPQEEEFQALTEWELFIRMQKPPIVHMGGDRLYEGAVWLPNGDIKLVNGVVFPDPDMWRNCQWRRVGGCVESTRRRVFLANKWGAVRRVLVICPVCYDDWNAWMDEKAKSARAARVAAAAEAAADPDAEQSAASITQDPRFLEAEALMREITGGA